MTQAARPDPARTPCRDDHVRLGPAPSGTRGQAQLPAGPLALRRRHPVPVWAVVSAGLSPVLATAGWLIAGAAQPASYSPVATTISVMAGHGGTDRWIMTAALFLVGGCQLVTAAGLPGLRVPARIVLAIGGFTIANPRTPDAVTRALGRTISSWWSVRKRRATSRAYGSSQNSSSSKPIEAVVT